MLLICLLIASTVALEIDSGSMEGYFTYQELLTHLEGLNEKHPDIVSTPRTIGNTVQGEKILMLELADKTGLEMSERGTMLVIAAHHAKELISVSQALYVIDRLLKPDVQTLHLLKTRRLLVVPVLNTDTYKLISEHFTRHGSITDLRKNRRENNCSNDVDKGVDLNRNYEEGWGIDDIGSSRYPCDEDYRGASAFSEPETQAIRDVIAEYKPQTAISYHSWGDLYIIPFGAYDPDGAKLFKSQDDYDFLYDIGKKASLPVGAVFGTPLETVNYKGNGIFVDYAYSQGVMGMAVELGHDKHFHPPKSDIKGILKNHYQPFLYMLDKAGASLTLAANITKHDSQLQVSVTVNNEGLKADFGTVLLISLHLESQLEGARCSEGNSTFNLLKGMEGELEMEDEECPWEDLKLRKDFREIPPRSTFQFNLRSPYHGPHFSYSIRLKEQIPVVPLKLILGSTDSTNSSSPSNTTGLFHSPHKRKSLLLITSIVVSSIFLGAMVLIFYLSRRRAVTLEESSIHEAQVDKELDYYDDEVHSET